MKAADAHPGASGAGAPGRSRLGLRRRAAPYRTPSPAAAGLGPRRRALPLPRPASVATAGLLAAGLLVSGLLATLAATAGLVAAAGLLGTAPARAAAPDAAAQATLDRSVRFLQDAQNSDGGFGGRFGDPSDPIFSAWAAYALAAAGINPQDQAQPGGSDVYSYLTAHTGELEQTTDFDRVALVAIASGTSPSDFGGADPIGTILSRQRPDGSFTQLAGGQSGWVNATIWSIFPLTTVATPAASEAVKRAVEWLLGQQREDGSWPSFSPESSPDADMTGAAIEALNAAGWHETEAQRRAFEYLRGAQHEDGGFEATPGGRSNSATTAWVAQAIWSAGIDPRSWRTATGGEPLAFLASLQRADGSIGWTAESDENSLWMTAQVAPALAGLWYPLPAPPRSAPPPPRAAAAETVAAGQVRRAPRRGHGGNGFVHGEGVVAGGGGRGAALFSAPQPQSGGSTPHGERRLRGAAAARRWQARPQRGRRGGGDSPSPARAPSPRRGGGEAGTVEGLLVGGRPGAAAPGLFAADRGGRPDRAVLLGLLGAMALAAAVGSRRERAGARPA